MTIIVVKHFHISVKLQDENENLFVIVFGLVVVQEGNSDDLLTMT